MVLKSKIAVLLFSISLSLFSLISCESETENRIVIWSNCSEFAQYVELYNKSHKTNKAVIVYKENPAKSLPPSKDEAAPDIVVGPWLQSDSVYRNFKSLDYIFDRRILTSSIFYPQLLETGKFYNTQTLLPVSFNLPTVIFSNANSDKIQDNFTLTLEDIRAAASEFNKQSRSGAYRKMGFVLTSNPEFVYLASKIYGTDFHNEGNKIKWNEEKFSESISKLSDWINTENGSVQTEQDFSFKYLFMPDYRQVGSDYTLFSYTSSERLFDTLHNQELSIDYRWVANNGEILINDDMVFMGIYKRTKNQAGCTEFISWLFDAYNQDKILERKNELNLNTEQFGFAGGFSALRFVTEKVIPKYYTQVLTNLPPAQMLKEPSRLNPRWDDYRRSVVEPFLIDSIKAIDDEEFSANMEDYEKDWRKKVFD